MYNVIKENDKSKYNITEFVCDSVEDIASLPNTVAPGSTAIVIKETRVFMLNNKGEWEEL